ncbi:hypothetical protein ABTX82_37910 [Streptomyces lavendulae]|uniref:hypothetical protein n=1 Tax=Streptomyces lavendulae TaxID=1914 RepID=UPI0032DAD89B
MIVAPFRSMVMSLLMAGRPLAGLPGSGAVSVRTSGSWSRRCRLLAPARVDAGSGYRYYAPEQARDALTIALLRDMDLPLAVIARTPASRRVYVTQR